MSNPSHDTSSFNHYVPVVVTSPTRFEKESLTRGAHVCFDLVFVSGKLIVKRYVLSLKTEQCPLFRESYLQAE